MDGYFADNAISVVGATLNNTTGDVKLNVGRAKDDHTSDAMHQNTIAIDFSLNLEGVEDPEHLKVPVKVTMPIPDDINPEFLIILHYRQDGTTETVFTNPYKENGQWYVSFVLTSFSDFSMIQTSSSTGDTTDDTTNSGTPIYPTGSGSTTTTTTGTVTVSNPSTANGTVSSNVSTAKTGDTVTVTSKANSGYISAAPIVTDKNGNAVDVTRNADGTYSFTMPEGGVTVTGSYVTPGQMFSDVNDSLWYRESIAYAVENGLMDGVDNGQFNPSGTTTRAMIMTILARQFGVDTTATGSEPWYQKGMEWAMANGISDGTNPRGSITREQLATMLWRFAGEPEVTGDLSAYPDADAIHDWAGAAMIWAVQTGIIQGSDGKLNPQGNAIRSQAAAMLTRFCQNIEK